MFEDGALNLEDRTQLNQTKDDYFQSAPSPAPIDRLKLVNVRDYGDGLVEVGYCSISHSGRSTSPSRNDDESKDSQNEETKKGNLQRSVRRTKAQVRRKCMAGRLDHLLTLTYRADGEELFSCSDTVLAYQDFKRFIRLVRKSSKIFDYVCVHELHNSGAIHFHVAVRGFQNVLFLRQCWHQAISYRRQDSKTPGNINVKMPKYSVKALWAKAKLAMYLSKYISKGTPSTDASQRYRVSQGIVIPSQKVIMRVPLFYDFVAEVFDSLGVSVSFHWSAPDGGGHGWACSW